MSVQMETIPTPPPPVQPMMSAKETLYSIARECLDEVGGNVSKAVDRFVATLRERPHLMKELAAEIVLTVAKAATERAHQAARKAVVDPRHGKRQAETLAKVINDALLDFPLAGGIKLRDATRLEVEDQARHYEKQGATMRSGSFSNFGSSVWAMSTMLWAAGVSYL